MATLETKSNPAQQQHAEPMSTTTADPNKSKLVSDHNGSNSASSSDGGLPSPQSPQSSVDLNKEATLNVLKGRDADDKNRMQQQLQQRGHPNLPLNVHAMSPLSAGSTTTTASTMSMKATSASTGAPNAEDKRINNNTSSYISGGRLKFFKGMLIFSTLPRCTFSFAAGRLNSAITPFDLD